MNETICALATAPGGALGIIRISGVQALEILSRIFTKDLTTAQPNTIHYGHIVENLAIPSSQLIDEVLVSVFRAPHSYTGEDSAEISCHGSRYILNKILELLIQNGCRMAEPGEFTQRAYLNGKMDLSQAEAVADLIASSNHATHQIAMSQLRGHFSSQLAQLREQLLKLTSLLELELDFSDHEDLEFADRSELKELTKTINNHIIRLAHSFETGKAIKQGIPVAIIGKTNVGKSTLFNRLTKTRQAIVSDEAGTTRDRQYGHCDWNGREFSVVDTGGWVVNSDDIFEEEIRKQVMVATEEADLLLFLVDGQNGLTDWDSDVAKILRRTKLPVILVVNKVDNNEDLYVSGEFYKLGLGDPVCVSAATGSGTGDLLDLVLEKLPEKSGDLLEEGIPRFAVVGRPNAGKSSIINAFIGEERHIVTEIAGTTRDSIYTRYDKFGFDFYLVDTAGIRRKNKVNEDLEFYSVMRSIRAIENSDVCILMLDATRGIEAQDMNIFQLIQKNQKSLVVVVNKWDLVEDKSQKAIKYFEDVIREHLSPFKDFPIIFASALTKQRIFKVLETAKQVYLNRKVKIGTSKLNEVLLPIIEATPPPSIKGKYIKIKYISQVPDTQIPTFVFYANLPQYVKEPYRRFLENKIRENWSLTGSPINVFVRQK